MTADKLTAPPLVIGLNGPKGVGKTVIANYLVSHFHFHEFTFADTQKEIVCRTLLGAPVEDWDAIKDKPAELLGGATPRTAVCMLGDFGRQTIGENVWIGLTERRIQDFLTRNTQVDGPSAGKPPIVISGVRYPNEAEFIRKRGGQVCRLLGYTEWTGDHPTEQPLPRELVDFSINTIGEDSDRKPAQRIVTDILQKAL